MTRQMTSFLWQTTSFRRQLTWQTALQITWLVLWLQCGPGTSADGRKIQVDKRWFVDADRRVRIFHGVNAVEKQAPWYNEILTNKTHLDNLKELGFNVIRLGAMWSGFEPEEGKWNMTYVNIMKDIVSNLAKRDIYTILEFHQDGLSKDFNSYDAIPRWLLNKFKHSRDPFPSPLPLPFISWAERYLAEDVGFHFQQLYDNAAPAKARDAFGRFWRTLAKMFSKEDHVLGYELINEPWAGDIYENFLLLLPGIAGKINLFPFYEKIQEEIRKADNETIIFYEPVTWGYVLNGKLAGSGFDQVPGGREYENRAALSYHYYCWLIVQQHKPLDSISRSLCNHVTGPLVFKTAQLERERTKGGSFLTEFTACAITDQMDACRESTDFALKEADLHLESWTLWALGHAGSEFYADHHSVPVRVQTYSRPYAMATAGVPISFHFDPSSLVTKFVFDADPSIMKPTEVFIPPVHYGAGFALVSSVKLKVVWVSKNILGFSLVSGRDSAASIRCCVGILPNEGKGNGSVCPHQIHLVISQN